MNGKVFEALIISLPDIEKVFAIEHNGSYVGIGFVLIQEGMPVAFFTEELNNAHL